MENSDDPLPVNAESNIHYSGPTKMQDKKRKNVSTRLLTTAFLDRHYSWPVAVTFKVRSEFQRFHRPTSSDTSI